MRFRQIHLDFHTSPDIPEIGAAFDKKLWQERLKSAHADSITCFSCCHHGWSYHPTKVGEIHPGLNFNLLRSQIDACHEIDVKVPVYLTAGVNNRVADLNPGWREVDSKGKWYGGESNPLKPGFRKLCFNSPYLDYLCRLIEEAAKMFSDADGMFFDIICQGECCCPYCLRDMRREGYDPESHDDRVRFARRTLVKYLKKTTEAAHCVHPNWNVFHNSGNLLTPGNRDLLPYFSHLELESLPTGCWGYDHYPLLSAYCRTLPYEFLGMTGKFHTTWGEFGGFKHPNALRYECAAMLAQGSMCSIGDQLHPSGMLDEATCRLIGMAYAEVERKEPWCRNAQSAANMALLSPRGFLHQGELDADETAEIGASRFLLESHIPFDRLDADSDFSRYKVLILPDELRPDSMLQYRLTDFLKRGGKLIISGESILKKDSDEFAIPLSAEYHGISEEYPNFVRCANDFIPDEINTPFVMYRRSLKIKLKDGGRSLGNVYDPYFVRSAERFCSHQHTPYKLEPSGFDAGCLTDNVLYFAHPVFTIYAIYGSVILKHFMQKAVTAFASGILPVTAEGLPSQGRITLMKQEKEHRYVAHVLYANTVIRGMVKPPVEERFMCATNPVEVIDELNPLYIVKLLLRTTEKISRVTLEPQGQEISFSEEGGLVQIQLPKVICHQMVALHY